MSKSKHTPGPWFIQLWIYSVGITTTEKGGYNKSIAKLPQWSGITEGFGSRKEVEANAHLIAAAPELLEALEYQKLCMEGSGDLQTFLHMRDAALARARGK